MARSRALFLRRGGERARSAPPFSPARGGNSVVWTTELVVWTIAIMTREAPMPRSAPVDGFTLAYDRSGTGEPVILLHGWPGDRTDYRVLGPALALASSCDVIVPDLRGFGESDKHRADPAEQYSPAAQARSVAGLVRELGLDRVLVAGYNVGSRVAQTMAADYPDLLRALVISPPLPGIGRRVLEPQAQREFWYQSFHQLALAEELIDGQPDQVRGYLTP